VNIVSIRKAQTYGNYAIVKISYRFLEVAMKAILKSTYIKCNEKAKYDNSDWNFEFELKEHESLNLAGQVQNEEYDRIEGVEVE